MHHHRLSSASPLHWRRFEKVSSLRSQHNHDPPRPHLVFHELVGTSDVDERYTFGDFEARPPRLKRCIQIPRRLGFGFRWEIVAPQKKQPDVLEHHLPEGDLRRGIIRGIARDRSPLLQQFDVSFDVGSERDLNNMVNGFWSKRSYAFHQLAVALHCIVSAGLHGLRLIRSGTHGTYYVRPRMTCEGHCAESHRASGPLHHHSASADGATDVDRAMSSDARNTQARPLFHRYSLRQRSNVVDRKNRKLRGRTKWTIRLSSVTPHWAVHPVRGHARPYLVHMAGTIAMRNHARIRHSDTKRVLPFLHVARVNARRSHPNANFSSRWNRVRHFADHQHLASRSLLFVPCCLHSDFLHLEVSFSR